MKWTVEYYNQEVQDCVDKMPLGIRAAYARLTSLLMEFGMDLRLPHSRAMGDGLFELRPKGREGIANIEDHDGSFHVLSADQTPWGC